MIKNLFMFIFLILNYCNKTAAKLMKKVEQDSQNGKTFGQNGKSISQNGEKMIIATF